VNTITLQTRRSWLPRVAMAAAAIVVTAVAGQALTTSPLRDNWSREEVATLAAAMR
jgi:hypothetical protein